MQVSIRFYNWPWITCFKLQRDPQFVSASGLYVRERDLAVQEGQLPWLPHSWALPACSCRGPSPESLWQQRVSCLRSVPSECQLGSGVHQADAE